jgi:hypothetical protein
MAFVERSPPRIGPSMTKVAGALLRIVDFLTNRCGARHYFHFGNLFEGLMVARTT